MAEPGCLCHCGCVLCVCAGDEATALIFAGEGVLYTGHISGCVRRWELPVMFTDEEEEEQGEEQAGGGEQAAEAAQQQQQQEAAWQQ